MMPDWRLRRAEAADAAALSLVAGASFLETFATLLPGPDIVAHCAEKSSAAAFAPWLAAPDGTVVLAELATTGAPVGYTVLTTPLLPLPTTPDDIELKRIYTLAAMLGTGLGPALLARALDDARALGRKRMLLGVHPGNSRARRFYEREGFRVVGERAFRVGSLTMIDPVYARDL